MKSRRTAITEEGNFEKPFGYIQAKELKQRIEKLHSDVSSYLNWCSNNLDRLNDIEHDTVCTVLMQTNQALERVGYDMDSCLYEIAPKDKKHLHEP
jgi:hypothetical protein